MRTSPAPRNDENILESLRKIASGAEFLAALAERRANFVVPAGSIKSARKLHGAAALLATSVLADSAVEHYRGSFENRAMFAPLVASAINIVAASHGFAREGGNARRRFAYGAAIAVGAAGAGFHVYNVGKRVGGFRWENFFYGAPLGAPAALTLSGLAGLAADHVAAAASDGRDAKLRGLPAGRVLAAGASLGLLGTVGEAGVLHFRGAFQNPLMFLPVSLPPIAAAFLADAAIRPSRRPRRLARFWLAATSLLGFAGAGLHCYGVSRAMGGWRNWRQNVVDGPPIPAPPSFSALALAGLAALALIERTER